MVYGYKLISLTISPSAQINFHREGFMMQLLKLALLFIFLTPINAFAYVGPGLGLGAVGAIFGVIFTIILAIIGVFWYPLKRMYKKKKLDHEESEELRDNEQ